MIPDHFVVTNRFQEVVASAVRCLNLVYQSPFKYASIIDFVSVLKIKVYVFSLANGCRDLFLKMNIFKVRTHQLSLTDRYKGFFVISFKVAGDPT